MIKIVFACNDKYFDGLYLSMLSILRRTKEAISFYLLSVDCSDLNPAFNLMDSEQVDILNDLAKKYNKANSFEMIDCKDMYDKHLKGNKNEKTHYSPYTTLRLLIDLYDCFSGKVIYLDVDTMANGDVKEFDKVDLGDNEFAVTHDCLGRYWQNKNCFNAGVMLFNMEVCRKNKLFEKARKYMFEKRMYFPDQSALNLACTKFMFFPGNERRFNHQRTKLEKDTIIKHFCARVRGWPLWNNIKQWNIDGIHKHYHIFNFDEDYKIYLEMKRKVKIKLKDEYFVKVKNLKKTYGNLVAVNNISFKVKKGSLFAFLGVNGAGKSTTINIISSTLAKDSGEIIIDGFDLDKENSEIKKEIGIVFQNSTLDDLLTVKQNLEIRGKFYNLKKKALEKRIKEVSDMLNLWPILNQDVGKLSGGQKRRVDIARGLIHEPKLLILDEPTTGLDPKTRLDVWKIIDDIRNRTNMTVFLTTHYLEEAEKATYVVIMNKGVIKTEGTPNELKNKFSSDTLLCYTKKNKKFESTIKNYPLSYDHDAGCYRIKIKDSNEAKNLLKKYSDLITDFEIIKGNMDSVFLNVTGQLK